MKNLPYLLITLIILVGVLGVTVKNVYALERTIKVNGVNYVSLTQMAKKYNLAVEETDGLVTLTGEAINLKVGLSNNIFSLNNNDYLAEELPIVREDTAWISSKDWAGLFNLSLTNYDEVSQMEPVYTKAVTTEAILETNTYEVGKSWGEKVPDGVRKHGNIVNIKTGNLEAPIYNSEHYNPEKEETVQGK